MREKHTVYKKENPLIYWTTIVVGLAWACFMAYKAFAPLFASN